MRLPAVIVTSVIRSAHQGDSHGGVYIVDLETGAFEQTVDWNDGSIDWTGRGGDRGLRGIAFQGEEIYIAASDEVFVYDRRFRIRRSFRSPYLSRCHEIWIAEGRLYLTSTDYDSILVYDLAARRFVAGYCIKVRTAPGPPGAPPRQEIGFGLFDPEAAKGPPRQDSAHLNSVTAADGLIHVGGVRLERLLTIAGNRLSAYARVPAWTHNARPFRDGVLANSTAAEEIAFMDREGRVRARWPVPRYDPAALLNAELPQDYARQAFGRGLCLAGENLLIGGSSPATVTAYRIDPPQRIKSVTLSMDVRNAVHGLALWPFPL